MANNKPIQNKDKPKGKSKVNTLRACMRDKKRYIAFEMMSEKPLPADADKLLIRKINELLGVFNSAKASLMRVKYDAAAQRGLLRVDRAFVDFARASFVMIKNINGQAVLIRTLYVSGMLNKAAEHANKKQGGR
jgi:RNase P/RNase MRP subunit POP5